jgi:hydroxyacyl-ACP dehydratase HTD2-like protein with hotdog domain
MTWERGRTFPLHEESGEPRASLFKIGYTRGLDGGMEYEFFLPVRPGDTLAIENKIKDIVEREGPSGKFVLVYTEQTITNQDFRVVAKTIKTSINRWGLKEK